MKIKFTILTAAIAICCCYQSDAQQIGVQAGLLAPQGTWADSWGAGFGAQAFYKVERDELIKIGGSIGYFVVPGEDLDLGFFGTIELEDATIIPLLGTFDYSVNDQFYVGGDAGYNVFIFDSGDGFDNPAGSSFALIPKVGALFNGFSGEARYNILGDSYFSILIGYSFNN